jgi:hypothetical protein
MMMCCDDVMNSKTIVRTRKRKIARERIFNILTNKKNETIMFIIIIQKKNLHATGAGV